ncbi:MAG: hypothetical protein OXJ53_13530 [Gammaproteobacteria bacterium]|nr:hypothetical protein [Gammaproteobacteria bacterium]MDE0273960.1 hypothetical protein [Gammaproteobacteria bacterium]
MSEENDQDERIDKLIAEAQASIDEAREAHAKLGAMIESIGFGRAEDVLALVRNGACSPDLQKLIDEDIAQLHRELAEEEAALVAKTAKAQAPKPRRRAPRRMTRI